MKKTIQAWAIFFGGFGLAMVVDYWLRMRDGNVTSGGIPDLLWASIQIMLGVFALYLLFSATKPLKLLWKRLLVFGMQAGVGLVLYGLAGIYYVVGTGIDSM